MRWISPTRTWPRRSKRSTGSRPRSPLGNQVVLFWLCLAAGCSRPGIPLPGEERYRPTAEEYSIMTYNLKAFGYEDRDGDGQRDDPKPREEVQAVVDLIAAASPDVLAIQEIGGADMLEQLRYSLRDRGVEYKDAEFIERGGYQKNIALLSRFPIISRQSHLDDTYKLGDVELPVARGIIDVTMQVTPAYRLRVMVAHLKSKVYHPLGQTEMRRSEARILGKHVRRALRRNPRLNLAVVGDFNDYHSSSPLRLIRGREKKPHLLDLRPQDFVGDVWTHFEAAFDLYQRIDYILVSRGLFAELVREKTHVVRSPLTARASDHRPLIAVFRRKDLPPRE
ncbi:MAG TPA: endonuclease/exonuclease/phosphatase family protein [Kiritimatiellae bacterium]|nr:endonuclease/exonuclease/phosphatase family protein [Kiritimatiellia bacterium]